jgi:hypothetical protein
LSSLPRASNRRRAEVRFADSWPTPGLPDISNNVGPVKHFLKTLLSFHLKEFFSFVFFVFFFSLHRRPRLVCNLSAGFSPT